MASGEIASGTKHQNAAGCGTNNNNRQPDIPLDFSFLSLTACSEMEIEEPRDVLGKKVPKVTSNDDEGKEKYNTKCLKLNNNVLQDVKDLWSMVGKVILQPEGISWIDLSFNELPNIDPVLCDFPSLQILYLHGNSINDIKEIDKLTSIPNLRKLCLHGNPMDTIKNYRWYVLSTMSNLQNFDMSAITKADRITASTWRSSNKDIHKKKKKRSSEA